MTVDTTLIRKDINSYLYVLLGGGDLKYAVSHETALKKVDALEQAILNLGINYMNGTQVCPWSRLGQKRGKDGFAAWENLRMLRFGKWIITFIVFTNKNRIVVTNLVHEGYNLGERIPTKQGITYTFEGKRRLPLHECIAWMVRLGCYDDIMAEKLKEEGFLE